jgi:hypothetical protein
MNHYLIKLREIEQAAGRGCGCVSFVSPPTKLKSENHRGKDAVSVAEEGFVSFVSAQSKPFENPKCATEPTRQNRQNPYWVTFEGLKSGTAGPVEGLGTVPGHSYDGVLAALRSKCPELVEPERWLQALSDAEAFLAVWGPEARMLGWTVGELFGLHPLPEQPAPTFRRLSRYDTTGLIWLLQGRPLIALTETEAAIQSAGAVVMYRKHRKPAYGPLDDCLDDFGGWR